MDRDDSFWRLLIKPMLVVQETLSFKSYYDIRYQIQNLIIIQCLSTFVINHLQISNKRMLDKIALKHQRTSNFQLTVHRKHEELATRVFPPQSFLFRINEQEKKQSQKKITNCITLNSFKSKNDHKNMAESSTFNKKYVSKIIDIVQQTEREQRKIEKIYQSEFSKMLQHSNHLNRKASQFRRYSKDPFSLKSLISKTDQQNISQPKLTTQNPPRKSVKSIFGKNKLNYNNESKHDTLNELRYRMKKTMSEKLEDIEAKMEDIASQNILQLMTIFSIKEQKKPKLTIDHRQQKQTKKIILKTLIPQNHRIKMYKKKKYEENEVEIDLNTDKIYFKKIYAYLSFLSKVKFSNGFSIKNISLNERYNNQKVQVYVGNGNNKYLIIALLRRRFWLQISNKITKDTKFVWTQNSIKQIHQTQQKKRALIKRNVKTKTQTREQNQSIFCEQGQTRDENNPEKQFTIEIVNSENQQKEEQTIKFVSVESSPPKLFKINQKAKQHKIQLSKHSHKLFINNNQAERAEKMLQNFRVHTKNKPTEYHYNDLPTITNHIPHNSFIGSKKALFYTMQHYYRQIKKIDPFTIIPKTYHFKALDDQAYNRFIEEQKQYNQKSIWIVKPGECSNRGNGIYLMKAGQVTRKLLKKQFHQNGQARTTIIQSYITDPLLYNGRKFDIRHYLMITIVNGNLKAYWYKQGYLRTSSQFFSLSNLNDQYIHLTNDAVQKNSQKYGKYEPGNKLSYSQFQRYLDNTHTKSRINFKQQILPLMKQIATDVVRANYLNLDKERRQNNFEIFGMDFMIDSKFKPWLIEINANPCLEISCHLLSRIIPIMLQHSLRLSLDSLIMPPSHYPPNYRYYLPDNFLQNLRYEIIFDENEQKCKLQNKMELSYDFQFDQPQDEYQNQGTEIDLNKVLD